MSDASTLRARNAPGAGRVSFVELFFDLVFVFAVTQVSHLIIAHPDWAHVAQAAFLLAAIWTLWMWTTWAINWINVETTPARMMMFAMMGLGLILSAALPRAFSDMGLVFALAYVVMQNGRNLFLLWALRAGAKNEIRNFQRVQFWKTLSAICWISGAFNEGPWRWLLWGTGLFLEAASPWWNLWAPGLGASTTADWSVDCHHMAERCGLFVIIALGETIVLMGATFASAPWTSVAVAALIGAVIAACAMWWIYFASGYDEALEEFENHPDPGSLARAAYTYAHIPMIAGIVAFAVAVELVLAHPLGHADFATRASVLGGPALFLIGHGWFSYIFCKEVPLPHLIGISTLAAAFFVLADVSPAANGAAAALIIVLVALFETLRSKSEPESAGRIQDA